MKRLRIEERQIFAWREMPVTSLNLELADYYQLVCELTEEINLLRETCRKKWPATFPEDVEEFNKLSGDLTAIHFLSIKLSVAQADEMTIRQVIKEKGAR